MTAVAVKGSRYFVVRRLVDFLPWHEHFFVCLWNEGVSASRCMLVLCEWFWWAFSALLMSFWTRLKTRVYAADSCVRGKHVVTVHSQLDLSMAVVLRFCCCPSLSTYTPVFACLRENTQAQPTNTLPDTALARHTSPPSSSPIPDLLHAVTATQVGQPPGGGLSIEQNSSHSLHSPRHPREHGYASCWTVHRG